MRGFVLHTQLVKDEDLVVTILTKNKIERLYRFYGARHSTINLGFLIDFEIEHNAHFKRLRHVMQIGFGFLGDIEKMLIWQDFIRILYKHLFDVEEIDEFYFMLLMDIIANFHRDPKRVLIESYVKLLKFEGRLSEFECFVCEKKIQNHVNLVRGFLCACDKCIQTQGFDICKIQTLFAQEKTILLDNAEIDRLYKILMLGI
ncbi:MAG: recombination protein RecO [Epsilonproteobacteria bacterium]|nr:recombination protein RecO [Campylobacterota bacterium]